MIKNRTYPTYHSVNGARGKYSSAPVKLRNKAELQARFAGAIITTTVNNFTPLTNK